MEQSVWPNRPTVVSLEINFLRFHLLDKLSKSVLMQWLKPLSFMLRRKEQVDKIFNIRSRIFSDRSLNFTVL